MTIRRKALGEKAEREAASFLKDKGYRILEQNFRNRLGEIDIIAQDKGVICFVEVKMRSNLSLGVPAEAITKVKMRKLVQVALSYLKFKRKLDAPSRFDVVSVLNEPSHQRIEIIKNAFDLNAIT